MTLARALTFLAFVVFCGFLGILLAWVPRLDLGGVIVVSGLVAFYDLFLHRPPSARR